MRAVLYVFEGGGEVVKVKATNDTLFVCGALTNNKFVPIHPLLFKPDRERMAKAKLLRYKWSKLNENEKDVYLVYEFSGMGYKLKNKSVVDKNV